jgi:hypothetical protein
LNTPSGTKTVGAVSKRELPVPLLAEPQIYLHGIIHVLLSFC